MALSLPRCAPPEPLHQLSSIRQGVSASRPRRSAQAKHGAMESRPNMQVAATDHVKISTTEPCCKISPLLVVSRKPVRRSSQLRVRKGREEARPAIDPLDMEAAEWVSRVLARNGVVEVDPLTIAEQITAEKMGTTTNSTRNPVASLTTSSEVPDYFPPTGGLPRVPFGVVLAAAFAVVVATVAVLLQSLRRQRAGVSASPNQSGSEGSNLTSNFASEPAKTLNGNAAILTSFDLRPSSGLHSSSSSMPLPPSLFKDESKRDTSPHEQDSVTPLKYKSVSPFFPSDRAIGAVGHENDSSSESVTPFFPDDQGNERRNGQLLENVAPFFSDEQDSKRKNGPTLETVTPFFNDEQGSKRKSGPALETVTPFFVDEQERGSAGVSQSKSKFNLENVVPFFPDDRVGRAGSPGQPSDRLNYSGPTPSQFREQSGIWDGESSGALRDSLAEAVSPDSIPKLPKMVDLRERRPAVKPSQFSDLRSMGDERVFVAIFEDLLSSPMQPEGKQMLAQVADRPQEQYTDFMEGTTEERLASKMGDALPFQDAEAPSMEEEYIVLEVQVERELTPEELALLAEKKAEGERQSAKFRALQAAFPAVAIGAGALGALAGVDGAFEMVGFTATASFISYELLWANKRNELLEELSKITDHNKLFRFLQKRKIVKDC